MSEDWAAIAADATDAINSVGYSVLVTRQVLPAPSTPWDATPITATTFACMIVDQGIKFTRDPATSELTSRRVVLAPVATAPEVGDVVTIGGSDHAVLSVQPIAPGGVSVLAKVELEA